MHWTSAKYWTDEQRTIFFKSWSDQQLFDWLISSKRRIKSVHERSRKALYINFNHKIRAEIGTRIAKKVLDDTAKSE